MKLLIRNLARTTTEIDLQRMFEAHGTVQYCTLVTDKVTGKSKGFGFIEMPKPGEAKAAVKAVNGTEFQGSKIRVKKEEPKLAKPNEVAAKKTEQIEPTPTEPKQNKANSSALYGRRSSK